MSARMRARVGHDDDGAILVIVLVVIMVIGLIVAAVVTQTDVSVRRTTTVRGHLAKVYAADAGVEYAIQSLKRDNTICSDPADEDNFTSAPTFNGRTVEIHCKTLSGSANGALGYAVIVLDDDPMSPSIDTQGGGQKSIDGPVYGVRFPSSVALSVTLGDVTEQQGRCTTDADVPESLAIATGFSFHCVPAGPAPDPPHALPALPPDVAPLPDMTTVPGCKIFKPGTYLAAPLLAADNYFASGVYYFANVGTFSVTTQRVVGGQPADDETILNQNGDAACATATQAGETGSTTGVKFILGGNSSIVANDPSGTVELFSRDGGDVAVEGTQGISVQTVDAGTALPWTPSTLGAGAAVLRVGSGNNAALTIHGMVYAPSALVDFSATNDSEAQLRGGVVAARLKLQSSAAAKGLAVSVNAGTGQRKIVITSTAKGVTDGERDVIATAVLDITSNAARTVSIESWNTT